MKEIDGSMNLFELD